MNPPGNVNDDDDTSTPTVKGDYGFPSHTIKKKIYRQKRRRTLWTLCEELERTLHYTGTLIKDLLRSINVHYTRWNTYRPNRGGLKERGNTTDLGLPLPWDPPPDVYGIRNHSIPETVLIPWVKSTITRFDRYLLRICLYIPKQGYFEINVFLRDSI